MNLRKDFFLFNVYRDALPDSDSIYMETENAIRAACFDKLRVVVKWYEFIDHIPSANYRRNVLNHHLGDIRGDIGA